MRSTFVGVVTCLALAAACGSSAGTGGPDGSGQAGAAGSTGAGGAGGGGIHETTDGLMGAGNAPGSGGGGQVGAGPGMLGNWVYASGTSTRTCPGESPSVAPAEGGINIAAGTGDELIVTEACALRFKLSGKVATIVAGQTCSGSGAGGQIRFEMMMWTLTLSGDGLSLNEALTADQILTPAGGSSRKCSYVESGVTLRRP